MTDPVESVLQNIAVILSTPKGSVPMYRDFGISVDILDRPIPVAKAMMTADIKEAKNSGNQG
ncbi:MAG: GPW/gp25 family protein [Oscillospiraceae bacterium]|nr:GPW/gp25 family protein [Oscillospiraceae bacterium]